MRLGHVHLKVKHLSPVEQFYCRLLGARPTERLGSHYVFLTMGDAHHEIALQALGDDADVPSLNSVGLYHSAFEVADRVELAATIERLEALQAPYHLVDHGISWAVYTADPDGNGVEIYLDRRHASDGAQTWNGQSRSLDRAAILRGA